MSKARPFHTWDDLAQRYNGAALLLGNGASIALSDKFRYKSLFQQADSAGLISDQDATLFQELQADYNFEYVLRALDTSRPVIRALFGDDAVAAERYDMVKSALIHAVQGNHAEHHEVAPHLESVAKCFRSHHAVFTLSYDLIAYWAAIWWITNLSGNRTIYDFDDSFRGDPPVFDPLPLVPNKQATKLYYLHGGLHMYRFRRGEIYKRVSGLSSSILQQFGESVDGMETFPVFVSEGHTEKKKLSIEDNLYLQFAFSSLKAFGGKIAVFGAALDPRYDDHIVEAIAEHDRRHVAIGLHGIQSQNDLAAAQDHYESVFLRHGVRPECIEFYDSASHPLGQL